MKTHAYIKQLREQRGLTQDALARLVGYTDRSSIAKVEAGLVELNRPKLELFGQALGVTAFQLMYPPGQEPSPLPDNVIPLPGSYRVPLVGSIACGKPILAVEEADEAVDVPALIRADFALRCKGDSMINARIFDGDIVYIRSQPEVENGQIAAVRVGEEATLKRVYYSQPGGRVTLRACNPLYDDLVYEADALDQVEVLGLAVGFFSAIRPGQG